MDLVLVSSKTEPKVCKIMNYGKFIFEQTKKEKESKRQSKLNEMKEIRLSANIAENDLNHKSKTVRNFIESGHKVKISIRFRGREIVKKDIAMGVMDRFANSLEDIAQVEKKPFMDGKLAIMILAKKK